MLRLCLTFGACCLLLACGGGHPLEGTWYGALPIEGAGPCRIRLKKSSGFDFACGSIIGEGAYTTEGETLRLSFQWLANADQKLNTPAAIEMGFDRAGNTLHLRAEGERQLTWERRLQ